MEGWVRGHPGTVREDRKTEESGGGRKTKERKIICAGHEPNFISLQDTVPRTWERSGVCM